MPRPSAPQGVVTRPTTGPQRLRRVDRWFAATCGPMLRAAADPLVVDLGFGGSGVTTREWAARLRVLRPDVEVVGLEIDRARVAAAGPAEPGLRFAHGGFELAGLRPVVVRAMNVLRQYDEADVAGIWKQVVGALAPGGVFVEGTCDELGRRAGWVLLTRDGPVSLTFSARLAGLPAPPALAERLPKALIHRNVPGEGVHALLAAADAAWAAAAPIGTFGARQRWMAMCAALRDRGWPLLDGPRRWRLGELTVAWSAVAPGGAAGLPGSSA